MGLLTKQQYIEQNGIPNNMVEVRLRPNHMIFPDVNRWISLLEALDIELPEYVRRKET